MVPIEAVRPLLLSPWEVRAFLADQKTQIRRPVTVPWAWRGRVAPFEPYYVEEDGRLLVESDGEYLDFETSVVGPLGRSGDLLWGKETWAELCSLATPRCECDLRFAHEEVPGHYAEYRADKGGRYPGGWDDADPGDARENAPRWRSAVHMPRWAARVVLRVHATLVERASSMTEADALACGAGTLDIVRGGECGPIPALSTFEHLWDAQFPKFPWSTNPWMWVGVVKAIGPAVLDKQ